MLPEPILTVATFPAGSTVVIHGENLGLAHLHISDMNGHAMTTESNRCIRPFSALCSHFHQIRTAMHKSCLYANLNNSSSGSIRIRAGYVFTGRVDAFAARN